MLPGCSHLRITGSLSPPDVLVVLTSPNASSHEAFPLKKPAWSATAIEGHARLDAMREPMRSQRVGKRSRSTSLLWSSLRRRFGRERIYGDRVTVLRAVGVAEGLTAGRARAQQRVLDNQQAHDRA